MTLTPPLNELSCSSAIVGAVPCGTSNTIVPEAELPGLIVFKNVLSAVLSKAEQEERITRNVARLVKLPTYKPGEVEPWSLDQLASFWGAATDHPYYPIYFLMGFYGLRSGEARGISWSDVDTTNEIIRIRNQVEYFDNSYSYAELKTKASRRNLPLVDTTQNVLNNLKPTSSGPLLDLIFKTPNGLPVDAANLRRAFKHISRTVGLSVIKLHAT